MGKVINKFNAVLWKTPYCIENYFFRVKKSVKNIVIFNFYNLITA